MIGTTRTLTMIQGSPARITRAKRGIIMCPRINQLIIRGGTGTDLAAGRTAGAPVIGEGGADHHGKEGVPGREGVPDHPTNRIRTRSTRTRNPLNEAGAEVKSTRRGTTPSPQPPTSRSGRTRTRRALEQMWGRSL